MSSQLAPEIGYRKLQLVVACQHPGHTRTPATAAPARAPGGARNRTVRPHRRDKRKGRDHIRSRGINCSGRSTMAWA